MDIQKIILIIVVSIAFMLLGLVFSLPPTFYPIEAEKKGALPSQYGFVFGIFSLSGFISAPICAQFGGKMAPLAICLVAGMVEGISVLLFGALEQVSNTNYFIGFSYLLRMIQGSADAASIASIVAILCNCYPKNAATLTSLTETFLGLGAMVGPSVGSIIYSMGGFGAPFHVIGTAYIVTTVILFGIVCKTMRAHTEGCNEEKQMLPENTEILKTNDFLTEPLLLLPLLDCLFYCVGFGIFESMLAAHMANSVDASQFEIAVAFSLQGCFYTFFSITVGVIADQMERPVLLALTGNLVLLLSFTIIGPASYLPIDPSLTFFYVSSCSMGFSSALIMSSTVARLHKAVIILGFPKDIQADMNICSIWVSTFFLGGFLGSSFGGIAVEAIGFRSVTSYFQGVILVSILLGIVNIFHLNSKTRSLKGIDYERLGDEKKNHLEATS